MNTENVVTYLKRPFEQLPKCYKDNKEQEPEFIKRIRTSLCLNKEVQVAGGFLTNLFLLYEENLNLPDMNLEELKLIFPYFFDEILNSKFFYSPIRHNPEVTLTEGKFDHFIELSQTKRIPLILGRESEMNKFYHFGNKGQSIHNSFEQIFEQVDPEILEQYMPLILQAGVFPGAEEKLKDITDISKLFALFYYYDRIRTELNNRLYWYTLDSSSGNRFYKTFYSGEWIAVEWKVLEFLQIRFTDWENRRGLTSEEQGVIDTLSFVIKQRTYTEQHVIQLAYIFDGDLKRAEDFLKKQTDHNDTTLLLEKDILSKLIYIASNTILDQPENGKRLIQFMEMEAEGLKQLKGEDTYWYSKIPEKKAIFEKSIDDVKVRFSLKHIDEETSHLIDLRVIGMEQELRITFDDKVEKYYPVIQYKDIYEKNSIQEYARLIIEGEKRVEIKIPHIISIDKTAFRQVKVEELVIKDSIENICEKAFESQEALKKVRLAGSVKEVGKRAFANCSNLSEILLGDSIHVIGPQAFQDCISLEEIKIPASVEWIGKDAYADCKKLKKVSLLNDNHLGRYAGYFRGCTQLDSVFGADGTDYLNLKPNFLMEEEAIFQKNCLFWEKIIRSKAKKLYFLQEEEYARDVINDEERPHLCCDTLEEVQLLEGTISLGNEFFCCPNLRKVILSESLENLAYNTFENQKNLSKVILPKYATIYTFSMERWSRFEGNLNIFKRLVIPENHSCYKKMDSIIYNGNRLCWASDELSGKIVIPEGIERIEERAFYNCQKITELVLPKTFKIVEYGAFFGCVSLEKIVIQGENVLVDTKDPDPEAYAYGWSSGTIEQAKYDILNREIADRIVIESTYVKVEKRKDKKKKAESLSYKPFADLNKLLHNQEQ